MPTSPGAHPGLFLFHTPIKERPDGEESISNRRGAEQGQENQDSYGCEAQEGEATNKASQEGRDDAQARIAWRDGSRAAYLSKGWSHIELIVLTPKGAPLPITQTGYLSHFLDEDLLASSGGPVRFFHDWIEREAKSKSWANAEFKWKQGDLFA